MVPLKTSATYNKGRRRWAALYVYKSSSQQFFRDFLSTNFSAPFRRLAHLGRRQMWL